MKKNKSIFGYTLLSGFVIGFLVLIYQINRSRSVVLSVETPPVTAHAQASPVPTHMAQISPDGTHTVTLRTKGDLSEILVNEKLIATRSMEPDTILGVPFNTWSPDNKYFFLKATNNNKNEYLVMNSTGKSFADETPYLMVGALFVKEHPETEIVDVTGWAAPTLLIINAKSDSEAKMSFWFDVQTQKFIRLSNYFY